jgi:hypothetical protein
MREMTYKCDLCNSSIDDFGEREYGALIKIKQKPPSGEGWKFDSVTRYLDICNECEASILERIRELSQTKVTG